MEVRNCKGCGKLFNYLSGPPLCPSCAKALDLKFEEVKEYVYDHPRVDMQEVSEVCEVSISQIKQWIREERLSFADDSMIGIECEGCGVTIKTGRFCKDCKDKLAKGFGDLYPKEAPVQKPKDPRENPKMRFLDQNTDK
ncbi:flagellar protein [Mobilitalea sibirica]|uniref:Flagellar protein n=1 Tax=Mobilitalea sibirica TaxID=1462919 RepID=A0A8J7KXZ7_9FIRM|nr:flagellar protein [Mobilitalea sibirica]MBH1942447.1 flagellar protein [Mobilitalea sibirica]